MFVKMNVLRKENFLKHLVMIWCSNSWKSTKKLFSLQHHRDWGHCTVITSCTTKLPLCSCCSSATQQTCWSPMLALSQTFVLVSNHFSVKVIKHTKRQEQDFKCLSKTLYFSSYWKLLQQIELWKATPTNLFYFSNWTQFLHLTLLCLSHQKCEKKREEAANI